jgi:uncharacterized protein
MNPNAPTLPEQTPSPWHRGERSIHQRMGTAAQMENIGRRVIRDYLPDQHRQFYQEIPFMVVGAVDAAGRPWASLLEGEPGFMQSPDSRQLVFQALPGSGDPLLAILTGQTQPALGMLGIELNTRRRNRVNGHLASRHETGFTMQVDQSFGNCPQYIQDRRFHFSRPPGQPWLGAIEEMALLDEAARACIANADTFFVASHFVGDEEHPEPMVDVSHRGGKPGFVQVEGNVLRIPDFAGNMHFNTFGNFLLNPNAGLLFVDFASGDMLQLTGKAQILFEGAEISAFQGAERSWTFEVEHAVRRKNALALRWTFEGYSPNSLMTGSWQEAQAKLKAEALKNTWRPFRIARIEQESSNVRSFYLAPDDGYALTSFEAGQHLPVRLALEGQAKPEIRTYTLSCAPSDGFYRLSIKLDGRFSRHMHTQMQVGDLIEARAPQGDFVIDASARRPAVLLAAGIGVTPMLAMLRQIVFEGIRKRRVRPTYFFYSVRHDAERAFQQELAELMQRANGAVKLLRVTSAPEESSVKGVDYDIAGRVDIALLKAALPFDDFDFYLCGPQPFMQSMYDGLRSLNIADERIHAESFGPSGLQRQVSADNNGSNGSNAPSLAPIAKTDVQVLFSASGKEARWLPDSGSLLELAEQRGLEPEFSCRGGSCGTCRTQVEEGKVSYLSAPAFHCAPGEALLCCAMPAEGESKIVLKL